MLPDQELCALFPTIAAPSKCNNTKLAKLKSFLINEGEYLMSHILEGNAFNKADSLKSFEEEWSLFEERHKSHKSPDKRLLDTASGLSLLYTFSEAFPGRGPTRLDYHASALVDEFVRRAAACKVNPMPQRSLATLLAGAVHARLPSWTANRAVRLWKDMQFSLEEMFPHAICWAKSKDDSRVGPVARNAIVDFCVSLMRQVLQESSDQDAEYRGEWNMKLRLLSQDFQNLELGELD